jgi:hypothetical protein
MKIVINSCYGGFGLSHKAVLRYFEIKGVAVYPEKDRWGYTYWLVPESERVPLKEGNDFSKMSMPERQAYNEAYASQTIYPREIERDDPVLVQVVEELGGEADGDCANLNVIEIPDDIEWEIHEYDGMEHIAEKHRTWC